MKWGPVLGIGSADSQSLGGMVTSTRQHVKFLTVRHPNGLLSLPCPGTVHLTPQPLDQMIVVFGGDLDAPTASDVYDPGTNSWSPLPPLPESIMDCACVAFPQGSIYLVGRYKFTYHWLKDLPILSLGLRGARFS